AIGIATYQQENLRLVAPVNDARAIAKGFARCQGPLFEKVIPKVLADQQAKAPLILKELADLRKNVKSQDLAVVFFAGHGVREEDEFFLLTQEANTANLAGTTLSGTALRKALSEFPCQVLLMLDACHSNAALKAFRPAVDDATRSLAEDEVGVVMM